MGPTPTPLPSNQLLDILNNFASLKSVDKENLVNGLKTNTLLTYGIAVQEYINYLLEPMVSDFVQMHAIEKSEKPDS